MLLMASAAVQAAAPRLVGDLGRFVASHIQHLDPSILISAIEAATRPLLIKHPPPSGENKSLSLRKSLSSHVSSPTCRTPPPPPPPAIHDRMCLL